MNALVLWEISRKQDYIFSSNRLKENIGASFIIEEIVEELPMEIEEDYSKNVVYNGGGGSLYNFEAVDKAKEFVSKISKEILKSYPGIEVFFVIQEYDVEEDRVIDKIDESYHKLAVKKNRRMYSGIQNSFGIETVCRATGLPAEYKDEEDRYISKEIKVKIDSAKDKRSKKFDKLLPSNIKSIREFDDLSKGDKNYLAVVHIDGNRMGEKFNELKTCFKYEDGNYKKTNEEYLVALKKFSKNVKEIFENAFKEMTSVIEKNRDNLKDDTKIDEDKFPVIPIIVAGDDVTYVTNGKIGIESARVFLEYLNDKEIELYKGKKIKLNACAGVAIVRISYPFAKAYQLAEDLCSNAKRKIIKDYYNEDKDFSLIDWHIEQGELSGTIADIREKFYKTLDGKELYMRPLYMNNNEKEVWTSYKNFKEAYKNISDKEIYEKKIPRSKLKQLRDVLKEGEKETERFLKVNNLENCFSRLEGTTGDFCFYNDKCMYYDAIEIMDLFINDLKGDKNGKV
ncbi:hypothetical protein [Thermoanaerobacterium sp. RBIITD]|uniref:Cas10/Cmr2 second palm domain-containing protein n=1 Tax=Thermoanaerobacterium sp. RBIITD TaxID=1550240 RepID=UPI000BB81EFA|nr:hypothetical protein [Thermoanaerobacterium sp. RBIITD]SNX52847.1 hypothetical protein SAMN05660242_0299 [Thermoanaerobacterium sp. RBIITD]